MVYPIIDSSRFRPRATDEIAGRKRLGLPASHALVLHVGHLKRSRNLGVLAALADRLDASVVMVASTSTDADTTLRVELEEAGVSVIRAYLPAIEQIYGAVDVYVFPVEDLLGSIEVPLSVLEAVASGLPVVTTPFGALPELFSPSSSMVFAAPDAFPDEVARLLAAGTKQDSPDLTPFSEKDFVHTVEAALARARSRNPTARMIAVSGLDGAGKSTQIKRLLDDLRAQGLAANSLWCRWDPLLAKPAVNLLAVLSRTKRGRDGGSPAATSQTAARRRSVRARFLRNRWLRSGWRALMVVDYGIRLAPAVRRARRSNDVVLLDRYWHDVMVDFSYGGPLHEPPRALRWLLPDADDIFILDLPEAVALERKPDTPDLRYLALRRQLYREVAERYGAVTIDASADADQVFGALRAAVTRSIAV